jgi:hypothetical protein
VQTPPGEDGCCWRCNAMDKAYRRESKRGSLETARGGRARGKQGVTHNLTCAGRRAEDERLLTSPRLAEAQPAKTASHHLGCVGYVRAFAHGGAFSFFYLFVFETWKWRPSRRQCITQCTVLSTYSRLCGVVAFSLMLQRGRGRGTLIPSTSQFSSTHKCIHMHRKLKKKKRGTCCMQTHLRAHTHTHVWLIVCTACCPCLCIVVRGTTPSTPPNILDEEVDVCVDVCVCVCVAVIIFACFLLLSVMSWSGKRNVVPLGSSNVPMAPTRHGSPSSHHLHFLQQRLYTGQKKK